MRIVIACAAAIGCLSVASAASAVSTFSFASDSNADGPTFFGHDSIPAGFDGSFLEDAADANADGAVIVNLHVDANGDNPGGGGTAFNSLFNFTSTVTGYSVTGVGGGFLHTYTMSGEFNFVETGTSLTVLTVSFQNALLNSFSSSSSALGSTATLQDNAAVDGALAFTPGTPLAALGITDLSVNEGFAFTLTNLRGVANPGSPVSIGTGGQFITPFIAEGSFSAIAEPIPAPGALALLGCAALMGTRRRRTA